MRVRSRALKFAQLFRLDPDRRLSRPRILPSCAPQIPESVCLVAEPAPRYNAPQPHPPNESCNTSLFAFLPALRISARALIASGSRCVFIISSPLAVMTAGTRDPLVRAAADLFFRRVRMQAVSVSLISIKGDVPVRRGLGSSATVRAGGLAWARMPLPARVFQREQIFELCAELGRSS